MIQAKSKMKTDKKKLPKKQFFPNDKCLRNQI